MSSVEIEVRVRYRRGFSEREAVERVFIRYERPPTAEYLGHLAEAVASYAASYAQAVAKAHEVAKAHDG